MVLDNFSRYRETLYLLTGVAAAFALVYCHNQYLGSSHGRSSSIRRRNAVRRRNPRRRGGISLPSPEFPPVASAAVEALDRMERDGRAYGTFRIEMDDGRTLDCPLIPSQLATSERLQQEIGCSTDHAFMIRAMMEEAFLYNFLAVEYPPSHRIRQQNGEWDHLVFTFRERGLAETSVAAALNRFNNNPNFGESLRQRIQRGEGITVSIQGNNIRSEITASEPQENNVEATADDSQSLFSWREGNDESAPPREGQNLLNLLYHIAEDQARKDGYIHRGVTCNSCGVMPIQGIRYRCANCVDYDLCETCEALQVHIKTHLFYKVRIPAPFFGNPRQSQPVWYPGKPMMMPRSLPRTLAKRLMKETNFENTELDALWDQFRCLASVEWPDDPNNLNMAIDRRTFDRWFVPNTSIRPPPPSLIYDRMFAFYDTNGDNLIGFEEFLKGLASFSNKSQNERLRRIFNGYDIDRDGYVERKDFLRIFRAYYTLSRELTRDMVAGMEDDFLEGNTRDVVLGSQPISAAFPGSIPSGEPSRIGEGKRANFHGDLEIIDDNGILREDGDDKCDRNVIVGDSAVRDEFGRARPALSTTLPRPGSAPRRFWPRITPFSQHGDLSDGDDETDSSYSSDFEDWPPANQVLPRDIINALGAYVPLDEVTDPVDRARIGTCLLDRQQAEANEHVLSVRRQGIEERWQRRAFYTDEEEGVRPPPDYHEGADDEQTAEESYAEPEDYRVPSPRSRSSSKVRFQDDVTDNEYETRSNPSTSSRSIPVGERWGGFEVPEIERDAGKEILYQVTQQGLNELLDLIFKPKEDLLMQAYRTRAERKRWAKEIEKFEKESAGAGLWRGPSAISQPDHRPTVEQALDLTAAARERPLQDLLDEAGYSVAHESQPDNAEPSFIMPEDLAIYLSDTESEHEHSPAADPTLPQNRPDEAHSERHDRSMEPFPDFSAADWLRQSALLPLTSAHEDEDPTLPQNRPDTAEEYPRTFNDSLHVRDVTYSHLGSNRPILPGPAPIYDSASTSTSASGPRRQSTRVRCGRGLRNRTLPLRLRFDEQSHPTSAPRSSSSSSSTSSSSSSSGKKKKKPILPSPPRPPSPETLLKWAEYNRIEREAKERGGSGAKLNFEEFLQHMQGEKGKRLAFVGSWIDMTSF